ncbi:uncharacterized protein [Amphiura filiformis]|uniref:uncharacterized protein n=1 Tax=Amphiura filiformis TaxID=82378 RepID=UPI003B225B4F
MSDTLASINVDQLSSAVNAVVHPADSSTQPDNGTRGGQMQTITSNQVTGPNIQLQVPMSSLPVATSNNTITIGNNAVPVMLVRVPNPSHQLTNQVHSFPLTVTNQMQALPMVRAVAPSGPANANIVGQIGNVAIALQPKPIPVVQSAPIQTFTLPNINQPTPSSVGAFNGNQNTVATDLLNMTAAQNITFGNILSVQQKPSSDVLVLNPTGFQLNPTSTVGKPSTALTVPSASNTYTTVTTSTSQSPAVNLNLNINLPQCSTQQLQPVHQQVTGSTVQTIQTTPAVKAIPQLLGPRIQLPQQVFQQILQPVAPSNSILPSSLVNIPVLSPNVIQQTPTSVPTSNITLQMAPVLQAVASSPSLKVVQQQPTAVVSQVMTPVLTHPQMNNHSSYIR